MNSPRYLIVRRLNPPFHLVTSNSSYEANNRVEISEKLFPSTVSYLEINGYIFKVERVNNIADNEIYLNYFHRKLLDLAPGATVLVTPHNARPEEYKINKITLVVNSLKSFNTVSLTEIVENYRLIQRFKHSYKGHILRIGQPVSMEFEGHSLSFTCETLEPWRQYGLLDDHVTVYLKAESNAFKSNAITHPSSHTTICPPAATRRPQLPPVSDHSIVGSESRRPKRRQTSPESRSRSQSYRRNYSIPSKRPRESKKVLPRSDLLKNEIDLDSLGIGGLNQQFNELFRRAFISRLYPNDLISKCGVKHVKGVILHGPPGTGKTLLARKIGEILGCQNIKIVNGPELLNRYVGQSEENVRNLFVEAEQEYQVKGDDSDLHLLILDEMDALCKARGTHTSVAVHDSIVNQLLTKMDGIDSLNNILIIGMTNRLDLLDKALLRPGRFELQLEISLPNLAGRERILEIHTRELQRNRFLDPQVNLKDLASQTINYTGAELEGLVKNAVSFSLDRHRQETLNRSKASGMMSDYSSDKWASDKMGPRLEGSLSVRVTLEDFKNGLKEIRPAFGYQISPEELRSKYLPYGLLNFNATMDNLRTKVSKKVLGNPYSHNCLFIGPRGSGTTALAVQTGLDLEASFYRLITAENLIGLNEIEKCRSLEAIFQDAEKSENSTIVLDSLERLVGYSALGQRYLSETLQTLINLISAPVNSNRKLTIIATVHSEFADLFPDLVNLFTNIFNMPLITRTDLTTHSRIPIENLSSGIGIKNLLEIYERSSTNVIPDLKRDLTYKRQI